MAKNQIPVKIGLRKNVNTKSAAYGKFYPEVIQEEPLTTRGLLEHIMSHGLGYPRAIVQGVLTQVAECLTELMLQGQPVKLDGFGTFKLYAQSQPHNGQAGITQQMLEPGLDIRPWIAGLRMVVIPEGSELDKLTSTANLERASIQCEGIIESAAISEKGSKIVCTPIYQYLHRDDEPEP